MIVGLQENALRLHEPLANGAVKGFPEISPLGVLDVGAPIHQDDLHVRQIRAGEHPLVSSLKHMGADQILVIHRQAVHMALAPEGYPGPGGARLQPHRHLRVMAKRFKMAVSHHRPGDGLLVNHFRNSEGNLYPKPRAYL